MANALSTTEIVVDAQNDTDHHTIRLDIHGDIIHTAMHRHHEWKKIILSDNNVSLWFHRKYSKSIFSSKYMTMVFRLSNKVDTDKSIMVTINNIPIAIRFIRIESGVDRELKIKWTSKIKSVSLSYGIRPSG